MRGARRLSLCSWDSPPGSDSGSPTSMGLRSWPRWVFGSGTTRGRSDRAGHRASHPRRVGFGILYIVELPRAVKLSDFRAKGYMIPAYPFLFFFVAHSLARCQDLLPRVQRKTQTVFLASVVVLGL